MNSIDAVWYVFIYLVSAFAVLAGTDWRLAVPMVIWLIIVACHVTITMRGLAKSAEAVAEARSVMSGGIIDSYTNVQTVKMFALHDHEDSYAGEMLMAAHRETKRLNRNITYIWVPLHCFNYIVIAANAGLGLYLWQQGSITSDALVMSLPIIIQLTNMSGWVTGIMSGIVENIGTIRDGEKLIAKPWSITDAPQANELEVTGGQIRFDNVNFSYSPENTKHDIVIDGVNLHIQPGEKIGLIGRSGAGKSTLVSLLLRFFELDSGRISIDGQSVADVTQDSLRTNIAMVSQDSSLLHRSIRDNIMIGRQSASEADMINAAKQAKAHEFILGLEDSKGRKGYDAHAGERGVKLSGGQRQRIALARVILKNAPILVLDEATSALDSEVEAAIQEQLLALMKDKTAIVIAHRLSTIAAMDRLIVLDQGRILEQGRHEEVLTEGGLYAQLWQHQSGGFIKPA